ncbi:nitroreductase family protein [Sphingosinithalassobacter sp. LHW66-3]|uniref:nitroreductase family protein n=1 Tax=Sphingosinithalassobacter sp. LHW66-3 TaxID=3424718 RepID=UPI003D6C0730
MQEHEMLPWQHAPERSDADRASHAQAFYETMRTRRSCRAFSKRPVPRDVIEAAIRTAGTAPSGANHQPWHFAAISCPETKATIRVAAEEEERQFYSGRAGNHWLQALRPLGTDAQKPYLEDAPWLIVAFAQRRGGPAPGDDLQNYYVMESVGIACGLLLATLHQAGLATLTHTPNPMRFLNRVCARPDQEKPVMIIVAGHAAADATVPAHALRKKPLEQITSWI